MFVRVHPGCGAIFVYFKTFRKVSYDVKVSVISFAADPQRLKDEIDNNSVSIWSFRARDKAFLDYSSAQAFIRSAKTIFDDKVLPYLVKLHDYRDFLQYYVCFLDGFSRGNRGKLKFKGTKIAIGLQCKDFDYVDTVLKAWEENLAEFRAHLEASHNMYYDQCIDSIALDMERINGIRMLIAKNSNQKLEQYLEERLTYWDTLAQKHYSVFYPTYDIGDGSQCHLLMP